MSATDDSGFPHIFRDGDGPVLLMLHGTGSDEVQIQSLAAAIEPEAAVLAPRGRVTEGGAARWFRRFGEGQFDVDDVVVRAGELAAFVRWATDEYGLAGRSLIAVGFSNGANIASAVTLLHPDVISRAVGFSGMYPLGDRDLETDLAGVSLLLLNGSADAMAPTASVDRLEQQALAHGADVTRIVRPGGHGITDAEVSAAREWLAHIGR